MRLWGVVVSVLVFGVLVGCAGRVWADEWVDYATVSMTNVTTPKLINKRLCYTDGTDIACDGAAGLFTTSGTVAFTNVSVTALTVNGVPVGGGGGGMGDRISTSNVVSGANLGMVVAGNGGTVSFTTGGVAGTAYLNSAGILVGPGISATTNQTSVTSLYASGNVGIGTAAPSATLHVMGDARVSGTVYVSDLVVMSVSGSAGSNPSVDWGDITNVPTAVQGVASGIAVDRISTSGVASGATLGAVVADKGTVSFTTGGVAGTAYLNSAGILVGPGISATTNQTSVTSLYASGNVGIGTTSPNAALQVSGSIQMSGTGSEACAAGADFGKMRRNPTTGRMQVCLSR